MASRFGRCLRTLFDRLGSEILKRGSGEISQHREKDDENHQRERVRITPAKGQGRELSSARFVGRASLLEEGEKELFEGEWGYVRFANAEKERLGRWRYDEISTYVREKIEQAKAASMM